MANNNVRAARQESIRSHNSRWEVDSSCRFFCLFYNKRIISYCAVSEQYEEKKSCPREDLLHVGCRHVGNKGDLFFPFPTDTTVTQLTSWFVRYLISCQTSSTHSWNEGLSTRNVDRSLCVFHYIHESMFVTPSSCKTSPTFRVTRRHWKAHEWDGWDLYMVHHRVCVCVCRAHQRKTIIGFCVQEIIIQVTWN
jgi:hypothetical protein